MRGEETSAWLEAAQAHVKRLTEKRGQIAAAASSPAPSAATSASPSLTGAASRGTAARRAPLLDDDVLSLLPRFLAWVHYKVAQIRVDVGNTQVRKRRRRRRSRKS